MTARTIQIDDTLHRYLLAISLREHPVLTRLREETARLPEASMQISPEQGQLMALLAETIGARRILEVGTFTGYSSTVMALTLPADGKLVTCDVSEVFTAIARKAWKDTGVEGKIELRIGPAVQTLPKLVSRSFDLAFLDADKSNYDAYYEESLRLVRPGGLILIDNVLWSGRVVDPSVNDSDTNAIRKLNAKIHADDRVSVSVVPIGDGLTIVHPRSGRV